MDYVQQRKQFGKPVGDFQHNQFKLADMQTQLHASRLMVRHAARSLDAKAPTATADAAMAKRFATDACYDITNDALQLLGGYGYLREYPVERCGYLCVSGRQVSRRVGTQVHAGLARALHPGGHQ